MQAVFGYVFQSVPNMTVFEAWPISMSHGYIEKIVVSSDIYNSVIILERFLQAFNLSTLMALFSLKVLMWSLNIKLC